nr:glycosyltransferase [Rhodoferax sp. PAMC 29310]
MSTYLLVFSATCLVAILLISSQNWHGWLTNDNAGGVQNHHEHPTPRVGGIAVFCGLLVATYSATGEAGVILRTVLLAAVPAFFFGLLEDITKRVGVTPRLLATMLSGVLAWYLSDVAMRDTRIPTLDWALQFTPFAVLFTAFAVGGVSNAINIIDGFHCTQIF